MQLSHILVVTTLVMCVGLPVSRAQEPRSPTTATAIFAGGCFWCMEQPFDALPGVISTRSGYTGGETSNPTYEEVSGGGTGHTEAIQIVYDPTKVHYEKLGDRHWPPAGGPSGARSRGRALHPCALQTQQTDGDDR